MDIKYNLKGTPTHNYVFFNPENSDDLNDIKLLAEGTRFEVNDGTDPDDNSYRYLTEYILLLIQNTGFLCKGLSASYVRDALEEANAVLVLSTSRTGLLPNGNIQGFAIINFNESDNSIHIDVICSHIGVKYAGDILIKSVNHLASELFMQKIKLQSVSSAITFYERYGFYKIGACDNREDLCSMEKVVTKNKLGLGVDIGLRRKRRHTKKRNSKKPTKRRNTRRHHHRV